MTSLLMNPFGSKGHEASAWRGALMVLAATLAWGAAGTAQAACMEGAVVECTTSQGCPGYRTCDGIRFGRCEASSTCPPPTPPPAPALSVSFQTSGAGAGREVLIPDTGKPYVENRQYDTQLFTRAQRHIVFTANAAASNTSVRSVKLTGSLKTTCMKLRETQSDPEQRRESEQPLGSENVSAQSLTSLSTSLAVDFSPVVHPTCDDGFRPWKQEVTLYAEATSSTGLNAYSYRAKFVFNHSFKVATYNVQQGQLTHGGDTIDHLARHMNRNEVDVVLLQETNGTSSSRLSSSSYIGQLRMYYTTVNSPDLHDLGVLTKFPVNANQTHAHHHSLSGYQYVWQSVEVGLGEHRINMANVHLVTDGAASTRWLNGPQVRRRGVEDVMNYLGPYTTVPSVFAGDFNTKVYTSTGSLNQELYPLYSAPGYVHFCWASPCTAYQDDGERFNIDQIWFTQNTTPALQVIDGYRALSSEGEEPSDHTMRVSRMVLVESP